MRKVIGIGLAAVALAAPAAPASAAPVADQAALREFEGTIVSVNRSNRSFRLRDSERGTIRVKVTRSTRFERLRGFSSLRRGQSSIEVLVRRARSGGWVARVVERSGGGGRHGGDD